MFVSTQSLDVARSAAFTAGRAPKRNRRLQIDSPQDNEAWTK
jgi:hypothetical protein